MPTKRAEIACRNLVYKLFFLQGKIFVDSPEPGITILGITVFKVSKVSRKKPLRMAETVAGRRLLGGFLRGTLKK